MTTEEFKEQIEELASAYALDCVYDPMEHMDAVEAIKSDYLVGAYEAYSLITGNTISYVEE